MKNLWRAASFAVCTAICALLQAQDRPSAQPSVVRKVQEAQQQAPAPFQPLAGSGLTLKLNYTGEAAGNVTGGLRRNAAFAGQLFVGADVDLQRGVGLPGAALHLGVTHRHGESLSTIALGNNTSVQEIYGTQNLHLAYLTWEQKLFGGALEFELGRTVANLNFLNSPLYCHFQTNSACGNPTFIFKNSNFTYFPASSWGAHMTAHLTSRIYAHVGAYEVNPDRKVLDDHGTRFDIKNATGVVIPYEVGYGTDFTQDRLPRRYRIGGWFDRGDYSDPLLDADGGFAVLTGKPYATRHGRSGGFIRFDQMLWRPDSYTPRGLAVFGVAMVNFAGRVAEDNFLELGFVLTGTFPGRHADKFGFVINRQQLSDLFLDNIRAARVSAGGSSDLPRAAYMMELNYALQIGTGIQLAPNLQMIIHPDQSGAPFRTSDIGNIFVVGFKFVVDAPGLLGDLAQLVR